MAGAHRDLREPGRPLRRRPRARRLARGLDPDGGPGAGRSRRDRSRRRPTGDRAIDPLLAAWVREGRPGG